MSRLIRLPLLAAFCCCLAYSAHAGTTQASVAVPDVVARVKPSVVRIVSAYRPAKAAEGEVKMASAADADSTTKIGSGFAIKSGLIATNRHVVEDAISVFVVTDTGARYRATVVGMAERADIALLRIDPAAHLAVLTFGDSDRLRAGDTVIAIGSPFGFDNTVTAGIVSSVNRDIMESPFDDYIQTDAAINHGNSGGPLFNVSGQVVGMNSVLFAPGPGSVGVGFAIPSNDLKFALDRLEKYGNLHAGMLPIWTQPLTAMMAEAIGVPNNGGALIVGLNPEAKQMDGEIQLGDVITRFNHDPVTDPRDLARKAARLGVGDRVSVELYRDGKAMSVDLQITPLEGTMPPSVANTSHPTTLGLQFTSAAAEGAETGAVLDAIDPAGSAADSGLRKGDMVLQVQRQVVSTPDQVLTALQSRIEAKQPYAALLVKHAGKQSWMPIALPH